MRIRRSGIASPYAAHTRLGESCNFVESRGGISPRASDITLPLSTSSSKVTPFAKLRRATVPRPTHQTDSMPELDVLRRSCRYSNIEAGAAQFLARALGLLELERVRINVDLDQPLPFGLRGSGLAMGPHAYAPLERVGRHPSGGQIGDARWDVLLAGLRSGLVPRRIGVEVAARGDVEMKAVPAQRRGDRVWEVLNPVGAHALCVVQQLRPRAS